MEEWGVLKRRRVKVLARHGRTDDRKDAGTDNRAYAQGRQRPGSEGFFQRVSRFFRLADQLIDRLAGKQLANQGSSPQSPTGGEVVT